jgi:hypothetical protein
MPKDKPLDTPLANNLPTNNWPSSGDLDSELDELQVRGFESDAEYTNAEHRVYGVLAEAYIFYRKVRDIKGYLKARYDRDEIKYETLDGNEINFRPFIRHIFRLSLKNPTREERDRQRLTIGSQNNRVADYNTVMQKFEEKWSENPKEFASKPLMKLIAILEEQSIQAMAKERREKSRDQRTASDGFYVDDEVAETRKVLETAALESIRAKPTPIAKTQLKDVGGLRFNADGLAGCICRYNPKTKQLEVVASSSNEQALRTIAIGEAIHIDSISSLTLRTLTEVIATQSFPGRYIPAGNRANLKGSLRGWYYSVYVDKSEIAKSSKSKKKEVADNEKPKASKVFSNRRVLLRGTEGILLSPQRSEAGAVTILKPKRSLLPISTDNVAMRVDNLRLIEQWLEDGTIAARSALPADKLGGKIEGTKAKYALTVNNRYASSKPRNLYFEDIHRPEVNKDGLGQVDVALKDFKPTWSFKCRIDWLQTLRRECFDEWFATAAKGNKLKRAENSLLEITIKPSSFTIGYELDDKGGQNPSDVIKLNQPAVMVGKKSQKVLLFAKDIAPTLSNVADFSIIGDVTLEGDADVLVMRFSTDIGSYIIAIPTVELKAKKPIRRKKWFSIYGAKGAGLAKRQPNKAK